MPRKGLDSFFVSSSLSQRQKKEISASHETVVTNVPRYDGEDLNRSLLVELWIYFLEWANLNKGGSLFLRNKIDTTECTALQQPTNNT